MRYVPGVATLHYRSDPQGNVQFLLNGANVGLEKYTYDAFGQPKITTWGGTTVLTQSAYSNRFMFTGREYLSPLGIYDYRHRFYHPGLGRFLETDPLRFGADDNNLYRYAGSNPTNISDPFGLRAFLEGGMFNVATGNVTITGVVIPRDGGLANWGLGITISRTPLTSASTNPSWTSFGGFMGYSGIDSTQELAGPSMATAANANLGALGSSIAVGNLNSEAENPITLTLAGTVGTKSLARMGLTLAEASQTDVLYDGTVGGLAADATDLAHFGIDLVTRSLRLAGRAVSNTFGSIGNGVRNGLGGLKVVNMWGVEPWGAGSQGIVLVGQSEIDNYNKKKKGH